MRERWARLIDLLLVPSAVLGAPSAAAVGRRPASMRRSRRIYERAGTFPVRFHYYSPLVRDADLTTPPDTDRPLPAIDMNAAAQLDLLARLRYGDELARIPRHARDDETYGYDHPNFGAGDGELLYSMIRHFKPRRILEIGSGGSTLVARLAIDANARDDAAYRCEHVCVEPYEQPWLERLGVAVHRERVEVLPPSIVDTLDAGDILFIDSSHVVRPQNDVLHEYLGLLPRLRPGVLVHAHDIFTPRDYPRRWILDDRKLWAEQYLLEAFLSCNRDFEVVAAANWLSHHHRPELDAVCPVLAERRDIEPGSFWFRRK